MGRGTHDEADGGALLGDLRSALLDLWMIGKEGEVVERDGSHVCWEGGERERVVVEGGKRGLDDQGKFRHSDSALIPVSHLETSIFDSSPSSI